MPERSSLLKTIRYNITFIISNHNNLSLRVTDSLYSDFELLYRTCNVTNTCMSCIAGKILDPLGFWEATFRALTTKDSTQVLDCKPRGLADKLIKFATKPSIR